MHNNRRPLMVASQEPKKIIVKGGQEDNQCYHVLDLYVKAAPEVSEELQKELADDKELQSSITFAPQPTDASPSATAAGLTTAGWTALGAIADQFGGVRGATIAVVGAGVAQAGYELYSRFKAFLQGDRKKDSTLVGLGFPDEALVFPENNNVRQYLQDNEINQLMVAYKHLCEYIRIKKNRDILYFIGLKSFNDKEITDPKYMAAILLAHKIESIFKSTTKAQVEHHYTHFKDTVKSFCSDHTIKETNSTDKLYISLQRVLFNIAKNFPENTLTSPSIDALVTKAMEPFAKDEFCREMVQYEITVIKSFIKDNDNVDDFDTHLRGIEQYKESLKYILQKIKQEASYNLIAKAQSLIQTIKLSLLIFQNKYNLILNKLKDKFTQLNATEREFALTYLYGKNKRLKAQMSLLLQVESAVFELSTLLPEKELSGSVNNLLSTSEVNLSQSFVMVSEDNLEKSWVTVQQLDDSKEADHLQLQDYAMYHLKDLSVKKLPDAVNNTIEEYSVPENNTYYTLWQNFKKTCADLLSGKNATPAKETKNTVQTTSSSNVSPVVTTTTGTLPSQVDIIKNQLKEKNNELAIEQLNNGTLKLKNESLKKKLIFSQWISKYKSKCSSCSIFSLFHFHGSAGVARADKLEAAFNIYFDNKDITDNNFIAFIREEYRKGHLSGNMNDHSLKMYLLTFLAKIKDKQQTQGGDHDCYLAKVKQDKEKHLAAKAWSWDDYFLTWIQPRHSSNVAVGIAAN